MAVFYGQDIEKPPIRRSISTPPNLTELGKENPSQKREELSEEVLSSISNREFLNIQKNERLKHITEPSKKSEELKVGDDINFKFKFGGKLNSDLYMKTTIGQVLPANIREVVAYGTTWKRSSYEGEFFTQTGQRLIIRDGSLVSVARVISSGEIQAEEEKIISSLSEYKDKPNYDIFLEGSKKGLNPKVIQNLIVPQIKETDLIKRKIEIEEVLTEFERIKDYYSDDFGSNSIQQGGDISQSFLAYYLNHNNIQGADKENAIKELDIKPDDLEKFSRKRRSLAFQGFRGMEELTEEEKKSLSDVPSDLLEKWKTEQFGMRLTPGSKETMQLFTIAGLMMKPSLSIEEARSWGTSESLHFILNQESAGIVGRENYTLKNAGVDGKEMKERSIKRIELGGNLLASKEFGVVSTAIGLGQLTMSNEYLLPNGRQSIGIPLEEAVGMLQYIRERYGNPEIARKIYGTTGHYTHPIKGVLYKPFAEGY